MLYPYVVVLKADLTIEADHCSSSGMAMDKAKAKQVQITGSRYSNRAVAAG